MKQSKIAIIGAGVVGSTTAYSLMLKNLASTLLLVDIQAAKCKGEVFDLSDAIPFSSTAHVMMGTLKQAGQADIALITAGIPQKSGQSRTDLLKTNMEVIKNILDGMRPLNPALTLIIVTNPVDILTYLAQQLSGLPKNQVFGSGTLLDTQRLRHLIGEKVKVAPQSIHVYTLGEHGDSQFVAWSSAHIAGVPLLSFPELSKPELEQMAVQARNKAYEIIECKGSTAFGIAACASAYCQNILYDTKRITPVSCYVKEVDCCLSMPAVLGARGVEQLVIPPFDQQEKENLQKSAATIKGYIKHFRQNFVQDT